MKGAKISTYLFVHTIKLISPVVENQANMEEIEHILCKDPKTRKNKYNAVLVKFED